MKTKFEEKPISQDHSFKNLFYIFLSFLFSSLSFQPWTLILMNSYMFAFALMVFMKQNWKWLKWRTLIPDRRAHIALFTYIHTYISINFKLIPAKNNIRRNPSIFSSWLLKFSKIVAICFNWTSVRYWIERYRICVNRNGC